MGNDARGGDLWREANTALEGLLSAIRSAGEHGEHAPLAAAFLTEAYLIWLAAGLRSASGLADRLHARREALARFLMDDLHRLPTAERQPVLDAIRDLAGEIGETAVREACRFRAELQRLGDRLAGLP